MNFADRNSRKDCLILKWKADITYKYQYSYGKLDIHTIGRTRELTTDICILNFFFAKSLLNIYFYFDFIHPSSFV